MSEEKKQGKRRLDKRLAEQKRLKAENMGQRAFLQQCQQESLMERLDSLPGDGSFSEVLEKWRVVAKDPRLIAQLEGEQHGQAE
jgi:hypothetical protein